MRINTDYYSEEDLLKKGIKSVGYNVRISKNCCIFNIDNIDIASNVRIDGPTSLIVSEGSSLKIGSYVHISAYCLVYCSYNIFFDDFSAISSGVKIYSKTDDYSGDYLCGPTVPPEFTHGIGGEVKIGKYAIIGANSVIIGKVTVGEGAAVGALSFVTRDLKPWTVYFGSPPIAIKKRSKKMIDFAKNLYDSEK